jgi:transcriptional regulator with XRE-family HTH domain
MEKSVFTADYAKLLSLLRETRAACGLTQAQLADRIGETQSWVSKCERGEHRLDVLELRSFCVGMDVPFVEFMERLESVLAGG